MALVQETFLSILPFPTEKEVWQSTAAPSRFFMVEKTWLLKQQSGQKSQEIVETSGVFYMVKIQAKSVLIPVLGTVAWMYFPSQCVKYTEKKITEVFKKQFPATLYAMKTFLFWFYFDHMQLITCVSYWAGHLCRERTW